MCNCFLFRNRINQDENSHHETQNNNNNNNQNLFMSLVNSDTIPETDDP